MNKQCTAPTTKYFIKTEHFSKEVHRKCDKTLPKRISASKSKLNTLNAKKLFKLKFDGKTPTER